MLVISNVQLVKLKPEIVWSVLPIENYHQLVDVQQELMKLINKQNAQFVIPTVPNVMDLHQTV